MRIPYPALWALLFMSVLGLMTVGSWASQARHAISSRFASIPLPRPRRERKGRGPKPVRSDPPPSRDLEETMQFWTGLKDDMRDSG
jgi:hypothetical protein